MDKKVKEHFTNSNLYDYSTRKGFVHFEDHMILEFIKKTCTPNSQLLEVGGGNGYMSDLISSNTPIKIFYNSEIVPEVYETQINTDVNLIGSSALNLPYKDCTFDYIIVKNLLHHLVGKTRRESKENAKKAIKETSRVIKDGGYIIILEQYNKYSLFASIVFYLTIFGSLFKIGLKSFGWGVDVIVSFLTPKQIKMLIEKENIKIVVHKLSRLEVSKKYKVSLLMSNIGRVLLIGLVQKK